MKNLVQLLVLALWAGTLIACGGMHSNLNDQSSLGDTAGFEAFKTGFYQFSQTQNCKKCHGVAQAPLFAVSDPMTAYNNAKSLLNTASPSSSVFVAYAGNGHCGDAVCSNTSVESSVSTMMSAWAAAELGGGGPPVQTGPKYLTGAVAIPAALGNLGQAVKVIRFQLSDLHPALPALSNAVLEIEMQLSNASEYHLKNIKIAGNTAAVNVTGVHVYIKTSADSGMGAEDNNQGQGWVSLVATAATSGLPNPLPTGPLNVQPLTTQAIGVNVLSPNDLLTIGFDNLQ
jgi:hypothetical protein